MFVVILEWSLKLLEKQDLYINIHSSGIVTEQRIELNGAKHKDIADLIDDFVERCLQRVQLGNENMGLHVEYTSDGMGERVLIELRDELILVGRFFSHMTGTFRRVDYDSCVFLERPEENPIYRPGEWEKLLKEYLNQ